MTAEEIVNNTGYKIKAHIFNTISKESSVKEGDINFRFGSGPYTLGPNDIVVFNGPEMIGIAYIIFNENMELEIKYKPVIL